MYRALLISLIFMSHTLSAQTQKGNQKPITKTEIQGMTWVEAMLDYRVNFHTVVDKFNDEFADKPYEKGRGMKQFKRWEHMMGERVGQTGNRPHPSIMYNAIQSVSSSTEYGNWSEMGPFNSPSGGGIGRINNVAFHPLHNDTIYAGAPSGGLWVSYDDGQNWQTFTDELTNIGISDLAIDPQNPNIMYLATGDRDAGDTYSFGLMKSTDGGVTWATTGLSFGLNNSYKIGRVIVHPTSTNIVVVATSAGIYRSTNYGQTFTLERSGFFLGVQMGQGNTIFATTSGSNPKIYRSKDSGANWSQLTSGLPTSGKYRCEVAIGNSPGLLYAVYGSSNYGFGGLYKSSNNGDTWTLMSSSPNIMDWSTNGSGSGGQAWYDMSIACDPQNENTIYVGGVNIWKSTNGGSSWSQVGHWYGAGSTPYVHADHHHAIFRPNSSELYIGTDGGVYKTSNGGSSWTALNNGMNITQYYKISHSTSDTAVVLGGAQDNGSHLRSSTYNWSEVTGGDGMDNGIDVTNDNIMYTSVYYGDFYKSTNGGSFFSPITTLTASGTGNWVTPFNVDPVNGDIIYAGFNKLWKSTNAGSSWSATSSNSLSGSSNIDEFEVAQSNTNYIYAIINSSVYKSTDGGSTWSNITPSGNLSPSPENISGIAIDPNDENHIIISISGYNSNKKLMESINGGANWINLSSGLPNVPANCVTFESTTSTGIYVGMDIGVFYKSNTYPNWISFNKNLPNVMVVDFEIFENEDLLRIGTYGRGVWQSPLMQSPSSNPVAPTANFSVSSNVACVNSQIIALNDSSLGFVEDWYWSISPSTFSFVGGTTDSSENPQVIFNSSGTYSVTLTVSNNYGSDDTTVSNIIGDGGESIPFFENFENGISRWSINNPDGGTTWTTTNINGQQPGNNSAFVDHYFYSSSNGEIDELISPTLSFDGKDSIELTFEYSSAYYSNDYYDSLKIYVSENCGSTWDLVAAYDTRDANFTTAGSVNNSFTPSSTSQWCYAANSVSCPTIDLQNYSGKNGVQIKFVTVNGYGNNLYIDNISVTGRDITPTGFTYDPNGCIECDSLNVGDFFVLNGDTMEVVDKPRLLAIVAAQGDLSKVCVSHITDMKNALRGYTTNNYDISHWDVSNVTNMNSMFFKNRQFNQDISSWNTSNVTNTIGMFTRCDSFNQDLNTWDMSQVTNMNRMFKEAPSFNGAIANWDVENVVRMAEMFSGATSFNQDLSDWCVRAFQYNPPINFALNATAFLPVHYPRWGNCPQDFDNVTSLATGAFVNANGCVDCSALNIGDYFELNGDTLLVVDRGMLDSLILLHDDLSKVCVSNITDMKDALRGLRWFNTDIAYWDVSNVTDMSNMFFKAQIFNQDIGNWDVSSVTRMSAMFQVARVFDQDISAWDVSNVQRFRSMFRNAAAFNQNIGPWDVGNVLNDAQMSSMFRGCASFNQDLSMWCVSNVSAKPTGFDANSALVSANLPAWGTCPTAGTMISKNNPIASNEANSDNAADQVETQEITLFPNPTTGMVKINPVVQGSYKILDAMGKTLEKGTAKEYYNFSKQPNGIYTLMLQTENNTHYLKVVKQ